MKGQKRERIPVCNSVAQSITQDETLWHNSNRSMTVHYAAAQMAELYNALALIRRPSGRKSLDGVEIARGRSAHQKSLSRLGKEKRLGAR